MHQFKLTEMKTNLLYAPESYALAHAVSADLNTMKGTLAWQFAVIFGNFEELSKQPITVGNVAVMEHQSRFIYFLVTKENVYETTTYNTLHAALICMREHMRIHEITKIAMPRICCGTDGLEWRRVKQLIRTVFARETNVEILVCSYNQTVTIPPKCQIVEEKGNILSAPQDFSLVHSTSADFAMSSGIGLHFKCKFGQINELQKQNKHVGNVAVLKDNNRYIYNLITKERSHEKCTYPALYYALMAMREHVEQNNVTKLAIHRFGGDIDRLSWLRVKNIVEFVFCNNAVEIIAYVYDPPEVVRRRSRDSRSRSRTLESMVNRMSLSRDFP
ncbi:uncharacterized protein LOC126763528 [Bactrocera neohumeralis]|uniref:Uncharacterized protein LOC105227990 isoform X1 n=1 Tax=Bactrocera dorsalis TaxID=27457 RepID=A0ABM3JV64_BACDO|nr:uncharacterized protein LOC120776514 isoform X1 [Bactrocera tryoni]XP_039963165.1 uncharacterized protein LOC120776514 isoform X1 [Bactrocera tryoni]XP_039963166.1 uncharacterized protein LOC120776514 isoform X1 [Bactrocera tryoni]XP_049313127.1 uncharacterized protein LOC105227990 isoform X1 [Bactrocera dorsalis]XP_049313129.1 uncharacterized protein LOC105227990 isoform X1 [Bactrocera dorsalis]XP_050337063.1 uncharacterized protein LOC126763528 [Bactrocera neohumeralis]